MLNTRNEHQVPDPNIAEWDAAVDEYERQTGTEASHRRLNEDDVLAILANRPRNSELRSNGEPLAGRWLLRQSPNISSNFCDASFCMVGRTWEYVSKVILIWACPNRS